MPRPYILSETNWKTVKSTDYQVAVLPWGATEAHNYHLPYATDNIQCDFIAEASAKIAWDSGAKVVVLPTVPFGVNTGQLDIKLNLNLNPTTQMAIIKDIADTLQRSGIPKLVIMNGHGGNDFRQMVREVGQFFPDLFIATFSWFKVVDGHDYFDDLGDHAGELETSLMMHFRPDIVLPLEEAGDGGAKSFKISAMKEGWAWAERSWSQVTKDTGIGNPATASEAKGIAYFEAFTKKIAAFFVELSKLDNNDLYE
ncbi:creatininase family protein [Fulvivirgaceae bacterium BMA12]|uniref:Creatininase family protein n=1 Tax=Agaribacillus aureus TaxID=3051825 RepID=A0ABT8KYL1_9BACT|nr:creatininase family protein [Fulvivirgaceae bacterium BMA12]